MTSFLALVWGCGFGSRRTGAERGRATKLYLSLNQGTALNKSENWAATACGPAVISPAIHIATSLADSMRLASAHQWSPLRATREPLAHLKSALCATQRKFNCASSAGVTEIFFFGFAWGVAAGSVTVVSSLSSFPRIVFARSITLNGRPASRAT